MFSRSEHRCRAICGVGACIAVDTSCCAKVNDVHQSKQMATKQMSRRCATEWHERRAGIAPAPAPAPTPTPGPGLESGSMPALGFVVLRAGVLTLLLEPLSFLLLLVAVLIRGVRL